MTDQMNRDADESSVSDLDQDPPDADGKAADVYQSDHLPATRQTRMRPNALDLEPSID